MKKLLLLPITFTALAIVSCAGTSKPAANCGKGGGSCKCEDCAKCETCAKKGCSTCKCCNG